jgi:hypothetical protein
VIYVVVELAYSKYIWRLCGTHFGCLDHPALQKINQLKKMVSLGESLPPFTLSSLFGAIHMNDGFIGKSKKDEKVCTSEAHHERERRPTVIS